jgi:1-acyl-sn-glycerol-3-phosphate acyltransferase
LCFATIKTAQSADVASEDAVVNSREIARLSRLAITTSLERLRRGDAILLFGEGSRSRTGAMQPLLPAVTRYIEDEEAWILPVGLTGTDALFPIGASGLQRVCVTARVGRPFRAVDLRARAGSDRRLMADTIGHTIATLLPERYRGVYGAAEPDADGARALAQSLVG